MISLWTRLNAVFFYAVTVLVCLACGSAITALWLPSTPILRELQVNQIKTLRTQQESLKRPSVDRAIMTFDMDAGQLRGHTLGSFTYTTLDLTLAWAFFSHHTRLLTPLYPSFYSHSPPFSSLSSVFPHLRLDGCV